MFDRPARPLRRAGFVSGPGFRNRARRGGRFVARRAIAEQNAGHDVEPVSLGARRLGRMGREPGARAAPQSTLFARVHGFRREGMISAAPRLHLDEHEQRAAPGDQIDLDPIGADVARDDAITSRREMARRGVFSEAPERGQAVGRAARRARGLVRGRRNRRPPRGPRLRRPRVRGSSSRSGQGVRGPRSRSGRIAVARGVGRPG